ncbi:MAG: hypothetical protein E7219_01015 [Clostridiales bacterium]|nr:hypothetical protein [Clostridiales bacterium]
MKLNKCAAMLLTLCLAIAMMPLAVFANDEPDRGWGDSLYVLGVQVTNANSNDVLGDGKVSYDRNTKTLTLNNAELDLSKYRNTSIDNNYACGINAWSEITVRLIGTNSIIVSEQSEVYNSKEYVYGIMAEDALTISGSGSLSISIDKPGARVLKYYGIDSSRKLTVDGSTLDVTMGVNGTEGGNGISATYQGFNLKNSAKVTVDGGTLTGVYDRSFGKSSVEDDSWLVTKSNNNAFQYYILSETMKDNAWVSTDKNGTQPEPTKWDPTSVLTDYKYVEFKGSRALVDAGRLLINGREITGSGTVDSGHEYHTGTIEYDKGSNTLTLTDAVIDLKDFSLKEGNIVAGIYATGDLNLVLSGSSKIQLTGTGYNQGDKPKEFISGVECWGTLTITGGASDSLSIELGKNNANGNLTTCGIDADEGLVVKTASLNVAVGPNGKCKGMYLWCPIKVQDGAVVTVKASGTSNKGVTGTNDIGNSEVDADSSLEMIAGGGSAFDCWSAGQGLKNAGALINKEYATSEGAWQWNPSSEKWLWEYKYVKFPYTEPDYVPVPTTDEFIITYDLNGGTLNEKTGKVTQKVAFGTVITLPLPTRTGYEFDYWEGSKYNAGDKYTVSEDHTFKAIWKTAEATDTGSKDKGKSSGVKTGDDSTLYAWIVLMAVSALGLAGVAAGRKWSGRNR